MSMFIHEKVVVKTTDVAAANVFDSVYAILEEEGLPEHINLIIVRDKVVFVIYTDMNVSFNIRDLVEKIHKCNTDIQAVCSIDMDSNIGQYMVTSSSDSPASAVYDIFSEFIGEVQNNLDRSLKEVTTSLFCSLEKQ